MSKLMPQITEYQVMYKLGKLQGDNRRAEVTHAVNTNMPEYGLGKALCGSSTKGRSAGWGKVTWQNPPIVTCKKCLAILAKQNAIKITSK